MITPKEFLKRLANPETSLFEIEAIIEDKILCYDPSIVTLFLTELEEEQKLWREKKFHIQWERLYEEWSDYEKNIDGIRDEFKDDPPNEPTIKEAEKFAELSSICEVSRYNRAIAKLQSVLGNSKDSWSLPNILDTERGRKYFAEAIAKGWMKPTSSGFDWQWGGNRGKARLAYFIEKIYCPSRFDSITPEQRKEIELLFGIVRLDRAMQQNDFSGKSEAVKKWKAEIDSMFKDD